MNKHKSKVYIATAMITISCNLYAAAVQEMPATVSPGTNIKAVALSHQEILTHLMLAEIAMQRNLLEQALSHYMIVAKATNDAEVAQMTTEIALQIPDAANALLAAEIWAKAAPKDIQAQLVAVTLFVNSNPTKTLAFLNNAFELKTSDIDQQLLFILSKLSGSGQKNLTNLVLKIADQQKNDPYVQLAAAQLAAIQLNIETADQKLDQTLHLKPDLTGAIELKAKLIRHKHNADQPALVYLEQEVKKHPHDAELRMFYITALTDVNAIAKTIPHLEFLSKDAVYGGDALIMLGEANIKKHNYAAAEKFMTSALKHPSAANKARYYLAQLAENKNESAKAITWYESVDEDSEYHTAAFLRAAYLYSATGDSAKALDTLQNSMPSTFEEQKQVLLTEVDILIDTQDFEQALDNCNKVIDILPNDVDFLYARSVVFGLMRKLPETEKDLRAILVLEPNNVNALNAIGFTLANQPSRINEATPFLEKALSLSPDNPAFMDSMGWLLYKQGRMQEAITILTKAYKLSNDPEIAAHLGEVLWSAGKQDAAKSVWNKAMLGAADVKIIEDTLTRLNIPLSELMQKPAKGIKAEAHN